MQKIFTHGHTTTYRKKSLVVAPPFSHGSRRFAPIYGGRDFFALVGGTAMKNKKSVKIRVNP